MFDSYFTVAGQLAIASAVSLTLAGLILFVRQRDRWAMALLLAGALVLRIFVVQLDPFLHMWDEAVHAVVAKNMASDPVNPMLFRETALGLDHRTWDASQVWVHKPPFFLWCMALTIKLFGNTVLGLRLPSALFTTALVYFTGGIGKAMLGRSTGFVAAVLMTWSHWVFTVILGAVPTDHNDAIFISLVGGSLWAWYVGRESANKGWNLAVGLFAGLAVLTKWLPGLLVFGGWGLVALVNSFRGPKARGEWGRLGLALFVAVLVALPWQVYAWSRFPVEMAHEQEYNLLHIHQALEGHAGTWDFHLKALSEQLAPLPLWSVLVAFAIAIVAVQRADLRIHALASVLAVHLFFGWSATKMVNYTLMLLPFFMIGIAFVVVRMSALAVLRRASPVALVCLTLLTGYLLSRFERIQLLHTAQSRHDPYQAWYRGIRLHNLAAEQELARQLGDARGIVFHVPYPSNLSFTFFHGQEVLTGLPNLAQVQRLEALGYEVFVVDPDEDLDDGLAEQVRVLRLGEHAFKWF